MANLILLSTADGYDPFNLFFLFFCKKGMKQISLHSKNFTLRYPFLSTFLFDFVLYSMEFLDKCIYQQERK